METKDLKQAMPELQFIFEKRILDKETDPSYLFKGLRCDERAFYTLIHMFTYLIGLDYSYVAVEDNSDSEHPTNSMFKVDVSDFDSNYNNYDEIEDVIDEENQEDIFSD